jgi:putative chitobiose transport system permease protein
MQAEHLAKPLRQWPHWRILGLYGLLIAIAIVMVFPMLWLVSTSLKGPD